MNIPKSHLRYHQNPKISQMFQRMILPKSLSAQTAEIDLSVDMYQPALVFEEQIIAGRRKWEKIFQNTAGYAQISETLTWTTQIV